MTKRKKPEPKSPEPKSPEPKSPEPKSPEPKSPEPKSPEPEDLDRQEDRLFEALWDGTVDGEVFDGDPADLW